MSLFNKVLQEHEKKHAESRTAGVQDTAGVAVVMQTFSSDFDAAVSSLARPLLEDFVSDALQSGFSASIEEGADANGNPYISVRFIPERGAAFDTNRSIECAFVLKGLLPEQLVEHVSYFDQRPGKGGVSRDEFEIQSVDRNVLENLLTRFLHSSLSTKDRV